MTNTSFRLILAALAATAALASCTKEITPPSFENDKVTPAAEGSRVIAVSFGPQTKTKFDGLQPKFNDGDSVLISNGEVADTCRVSVDDKTGAATISTDLTGKLTAAYPARFAKIKDGEFDGFEIPAMQSGKFSDANLCYAEMEDENESSLNFMNCCPVLKFYVDTSIGVKSIKITNSAYDITDDINNPRTITVKAPEGKTLYDVMPSEGQDKRICYVALGGREIYSNELKFECETNTQGTVTRTLTNSIELEYGTMYNAFIPYYIKVGDQKWGYCNVGAFLPEEPGLYFAWGDTEGQNWNGSAWSGSGFFWANAPFNGGASDYDGDYFYPQKSTVCPDNILALEYDAAYKNWGEDWRMPTYSEFYTMRGATYFGWDGTDKGCYVYDPNPTSDAGKCGDSAGTYTKSDALLFFPAAGGGTGESLNNKGSGGYYWSSSLLSDHNGYSYYLYFEKDFHNIYPQEPYYRCSGLSIRPIYAPAPEVVPEGALSGKFTINADGDQVYFSQGNLYCTRTDDGASGYTYSFAFEANQYDYRTINDGTLVGKCVIGGEANDTTPENTSGLFQWNLADVGEGKGYGAFTNGEVPTTTPATLDWGEAYNAQHTGENWATLKQSDWNYLTKTRVVNGGTGFGKTCQWVQYNGNWGLIIYCDGYDKSPHNLYAAISADDFPEGCAFLPALGSRTATSITDDKKHYWLGQANEASFGISASFDVTFVNSNSSLARLVGLPVRLVTPVTANKGK